MRGSPVGMTGLGYKFERIDRTPTVDESIFQPAESGELQPQVQFDGCAKES
jgi:hypothetical protein